MHQMALGLFRLIASIARLLIIAQAGGAFGLIVVVTLGGFIVSRKNVHPWWIWGYWLSPLSYAQNAITVNEFLAPRWDTVNCTPSCLDLQLYVSFMTQ
jgi:ABC-type multidrug transport system permease subunit